MRIGQRSVWLASVAFLAASGVGAQDPPRIGLRLDAPTAGARAAIDSFMTAVDKERWDDAARWLDMERFTTYFKQAVSSARSQLPPPQVTVEMLMAMDSTMTRAVAEWQLSKMRPGADSAPFSFLEHEFARVRTQRELFALTPAEGAARWLEAQDHRSALRESWRRLGCKGPVPSELLALQKRRVRGVLVVDSLAYAILAPQRSIDPGDGMAMPPWVIIEHRTAAGWRIAPQMGLLSGTLASFGFASEVARPGC